VLSVLRDSDDDRCRGNILPSAAPVFRGCDERQHVLSAGVHVGLIVERAENDTVSLIQKNSERDHRSFSTSDTDKTSPIGV
jgi:hypothetical protein